VVGSAGEFAEEYGELAALSCRFGRWFAVLYIAGVGVAVGPLVGVGRVRV